MSTQTLTIHRGADSPGSYVWSPFVTKLEFHMRINNVPYTVGAGGPRTGPTGKIPYIEFSATDKPTTSMGETSHIIRHLIDEGRFKDLNANLSSKEKGQDFAIQALLEEKLNMYNLHERWVRNFYTMRDHNLAPIPYPIRVVVALMIYRDAVARLQGHGIGRFDDETIHEFRREVWGAVSGMLQESKRDAKSKDESFWVMGGKEPTDADATVYGFVVSTRMCTAAPRSRALLRDEFPVVIEYAERIHRRYFPDYALWE